jgi:hypothetical protein
LGDPTLQGVGPSYFANEHISRKHERSYNLGPPCRPSIRERRLSNLWPSEVRRRFGGHLQQACGLDHVYDGPNVGIWPALFAHCLAHWLRPGNYSMLRNSASGPYIGFSRPDFGRTATGKPPTSPSGRPKTGRKANFDAFPVVVRRKSGLEGRFLARKHYYVT